MLNHPPKPGDPVTGVGGSGVVPGVAMNWVVGVGVMLGVGATAVTLNPSFDAFNCNTTEVRAGSLSALISSRPGRSMLNEATATPWMVAEYSCLTTPPSPLKTILKCTTVPSGTG